VGSGQCRRQAGKENGMNPQTIQSLAALFASMAAFLGGMYLVVTRPLVGRMDDMKAGLNEINTKLTRIEDRLKEVEKKVDHLEIKAWR